LSFGVVNLFDDSHFVFGRCGITNSLLRTAAMPFSFIVVGYSGFLLSAAVLPSDPAYRERFRRELQFPVERHY